MTDQVLESIIEKPPENSNITLAKSILKKRGITTNSNIKVASNNDVSKESITKRLEQIKNLYQKGLITQKEYDNKRTKILNEL